MRQEFTSILEKGRKGYPIGTIREYNGVKFVKVSADKWNPVKKGSSAGGGVKDDLSVMIKLADSSFESRDMDKRLFGGSKISVPLDSVKEHLQAISEAFNDVVGKDTLANLKKVYTREFANIKGNLSDVVDYAYLQAKNSMNDTAKKFYTDAYRNLSSIQDRMIPMLESLGEKIEGIKISETESKIDSLADKIKNNRYQMPEDIESFLIFDGLLDSEKKELLKKMRFTGFVADDQMYGQDGMWSVFRPMEKDSLLGTIEDMVWNNEPDNDNSFILAYDDGTKVHTLDLAERWKPRIQGLLWAMDSVYGDYWLSSKSGAKEDMVSYNNLSEWKDGREFGVEEIESHPEQDMVLELGENGGPEEFEPNTIYHQSNGVVDEWDAQFDTNSLEDAKRRLVRQVPELDWILNRKPSEFLGDRYGKDYVVEIGEKLVYIAANMQTI